MVYSQRQCIVFVHSFIDGKFNADDNNAQDAAILKEYATIHFGFATNIHLAVQKSLSFAKQYPILKLLPLKLLDHFNSVTSSTKEQKQTVWVGSSV